MDKILSARLDEAVIAEMDRTVKRLGVTKKAFLESAIRARVAEIERATGADVWDETFGAWARDEPVAATRDRARATFERSYRRRHRRTGREA